MLIMPIMINNRTIGAMTIRRTEELVPGEDEYTYEWELAMNDGPDLRGWRGAEHSTGTIKHNYSDGAVTLIKKVMDRIE